MVLYISWPEKVENSSSFSANFVSIYKNLLITYYLNYNQKKKFRDSGSAGRVPLFFVSHHRDVRHFFNLCATAPPRRYFS